MLIKYNKGNKYRLFGRMK